MQTKVMLASGSSMWMALLAIQELESTCNLDHTTGERIEQVIRLGFPTFNNESEYEAILVGVDHAKSVSSEKFIIHKDSQLKVEKVNREYETRDQRMVKYASLVKQRLRENW